MSEIEIFNEQSKPTTAEKNEVVDFLYTHLDEFGDTRADIMKAVDFSLKEYESFGGFVLAARENGEIVCSVIVNRTGMKGYIPENILVYIATHKDYRGKGIGKSGGTHRLC